MSRWSRDTDEIMRELAQTFILSEGADLDAQPIEIKRAIRTGEIDTPEAGK